MRHRHTVRQVCGGWRRAPFRVIKCPCSLHRIQSVRSTAAQLSRPSLSLWFVVSPPRQFSSFSVVRTIERTGKHYVRTVVGPMSRNHRVVGGWGLVRRAWWRYGGGGTRAGKVTAVLLSGRQLSKCTSGTPA